MSAKKLHFVLVHGSSLGAWCWYKLQCLMENSGYKVTTLDLKSAGIDPTDPKSVTTFDQYNQPLVDFLRDLPENDKVVLVGHSAGGLSVTDCIHKFGTKKIHMAFYVAANMLKNGFVTPHDFEDRSPGKELSGLEDLHIPPQDSILLEKLYRPPPSQAIDKAQFKDGPDADKVPRVYIKTLKDQLVKVDIQAYVIRRWPPFQVFEINTDHYPFFSDPFVLFGFIIEASIQII